VQIKAANTKHHIKETMIKMKRAKDDEASDNQFKILTFKRKN